MTTFVCRTFLGLCLLLTTLCAASAAAEGPAKKKDGKPACLKVEAQARYSAYGYDHLVHLHNTCKKARRCHVKTDVTPTPTTVKLKPGQKETVVTRRGSPARAFTPVVKCDPVDGVGERQPTRPKD